MSGHSKWATIHRQKEAKDAKRGAAFTKLANAITIAVKEGGGIGDPDSNFKLRLAVDKAREANMPKDNISRAIERGTGAGGADSLEEITFEGFGPGGVAMMVESTTDKRLRTISEVKNVFDRGGGTMGSTGSVAYMFSRKGYLELEEKSISEDKMLELIDVGAEDIETREEGIIVYCGYTNLYEVKKAVEQKGFKIKDAAVTMVPTIYVEIEDGIGEKLSNLVEKLEELDDVSKVYTNAK